MCVEPDTVHFAQKVVTPLDRACSHQEGGAPAKGSLAGASRSALGLRTFVKQTIALARQGHYVGAVSPSYDINQRWDLARTGGLFNKSLYKNDCKFIWRDTPYISEAQQGH